MAKQRKNVKVKGFDVASTYDRPSSITVLRGRNGEDCEIQVVMNTYRDEAHCRGSEPHLDQVKLVARKRAAIIEKEEVTDKEGNVTLEDKIVKPSINDISMELFYKLQSALDDLYVEIINVDPTFENAIDLD